MDMRCTGCHQVGGIAPFPLNTYADVALHASEIRTSLNNRTMPPPGVDNSGGCQSFANAQWLPQQEIDMMNTWIANGKAVGDSSKTVFPAHKLSTLADPKITLKMPQSYTPAPPAGKLDDYRCFLLDPKQTADTLVTAVQVLPDKVVEVHHVIVFKPNTAEAQAQAEAMDGKDGKPGYPCFGAAGIPSSIVGLWAPGGNPEEMRDANTGELLGIRLEAGRKLVLQVHYNAQNGVFPDQSSIAVKMNPTAKATKWIVLADFLLSLPPGQVDVQQTELQGNSWMQAINEIFERGLADNYIHGGGILAGLSWDLVNIVLNQPAARDFTVYAVAPHMHTMGRSIQVDKILPDNSAQCMGKVPLFDFNWQGGYHYVKPLTISKDDRMQVTCHFNTSDRTTDTKFGEGTSDEMCLAFLMVNE